MELNMKRIITSVLLSLILLPLIVLAAPSEIVIIRHADKWTKKPGPFLSPKGQVRAERFTEYYLKNFNAPDFIFASRPGDLNHASESLSMRPVQTIAPLANQLAYEGKHVEINADYLQKRYPVLADHLLHSKKFQNKMILICWHHGRINNLTQALGVKQPLAKWPMPVYDMVYVLKYNTAGQLISFQILKDQYPVKANPTWQELANPTIPSQVH